MDDIMELMLIKQQKQELTKVLDCNNYTKKFGIELTEEDVKELLLSRKSSLRREERVEFKESIMPKLIYAFCDSPYVYQDNYLETLQRLQEIFYLYKNESLDEWTDDELLQYMKEEFDGECQGSLDYLEETSLEKMARDVRRSSHGFIRRYLEDEEDLEGESYDE